MLASELALTSRQPRGAQHRSPVFERTARKSVRSGLLWGSVFGVVVASSAISYSRIYSTQVERNALAAAFGTNHASAALFGPAPELQTVDGFLVLKSFMTIMVLGALWGLLTSTRLLRGEEDAGRWDLLLCGHVTARKATTQALGAFGLAVIGMWMVTALLTVGTGRSSQVEIPATSCLYFAVSQVAAAAMFLGIGALTSQLVPTRRRAAAWAGWILGCSYLLRLVADAGVGLHGIIWLTPLGWVEELRPLTAPQPVALLPILGLTLGTAWAAVHLSDRRDTGSSILPDHDHATPRLRLLSGQFALSVRLSRSTTIAWLCAVGVTGLVLGLVAKQAGQTMAGSSVQEVFAKLGAAGSGASTFLGVAFLIAAVLVGFFAAGQCTATRDEEADGHFANLAVAPLSRMAWLGGRLVLGVLVLAVAGVLTGVGVWLGGIAGGAGVPLTDLLEAGINVVPPALCLLGIGVLAIGSRPRWTSAVVYGILAWSLLIELIGGFGSASRWLLDTSLFHHMAAAPAVNPDWRTNGVLVAIGILAGLAGLMSFERRDLVGT